MLQKCADFFKTLIEMESKKVEKRKKRKEETLSDGEKLYNIQESIKELKSRPMKTLQDKIKAIDFEKETQYNLSKIIDNLKLEIQVLQENQQAKDNLKIARKAQSDLSRFIIVNKLDQLEYDSEGEIEPESDSEEIKLYKKQMVEKMMKNKK